jgi:hypothetical protein
MKKRLFGLSKTAAAVQVLGLGLLFLISCNNIFVPPREEQAAGNGATGMVLLSLGNGVEGARTILPDSVSFQLYKLTIDPVAPTTGSTVSEDVTTASPSIELAAGTWNIHVDAYTDPAGVNRAAEGNSETFTVTDNETTSVSITLSAVTNAGAGTLSVEIISDLISYGQLQIFGGTNFNAPVTFYNGLSDDTAVQISPGGLDLDISLPAGQYRVMVHIENNEGQAAWINEVAYIYSNLETPLVEFIEADDFIDLTTISGTIWYQENGVDQSGYQLRVFMNPEGRGGFLSDTHISGVGIQPYSLHVPRPEKNVTLYFHIYKNGIFLTKESLTLIAGQSTATKDIVFNSSAIILSGTISLTVGGNPITVASLYAPYGDSEIGRSYSATVSGNAWTMSIPSNFSGTLYFGLNGKYDGQWYSDSAGHWTSGSSTSGIDLSVSLITLSGTIGTVTVDGNAPSYVRVYYDNIFSYGTVFNHSWQIIVRDDFTVVIGVDVEYNNIWHQRDITTWNPGSATNDIDLGDVAFIQISGTVTIDGTTPLSQGWWGVYEQPPGYVALGALYSFQIGDDGSFSGYIAGIASGYVVISNTIDKRYITPSPVTLGSSMSFNLSAMTEQNL